MHCRVDCGWVRETRDIESVTRTLGKTLHYHKTLLNKIRIKRGLFKKEREK